MDAIKSTGLFTPPAYQRLMAMTSQVQSRFIHGASTQEVFAPLLSDLLGFTGSEYGFIGNVLTDPADGHRFVRMLVLTELGWDDASRSAHAAHVAGQQPFEFHQLDNLVGAAVTSGRTVIHNTPAAELDSSRLPAGHPALRAYLGVPLFHGGELAGLVGLANRPGGYEEALIAFMEPLFAAVGAIIGAVRLEGERRAAEQALRESEERLQTTFELAAVGLCHTAPNGRLLRVNRQLCEILGYSREQLQAMSFRDVSVPEDLPADAARLQELADGHVERYHAEKRYVHADGHIVRARLSVAAVREPPLGGLPGGVRYYIAAVEDITARKAAETALVSAQMAERANAAKTAFLSRMSHELRTPLNAVLGFAQLLQMNPEAPLLPSQLQQVRHIWNAGSHLLAMINDVLDLTRVEGGHLPVSKEAVELPALVDEAVALVQKTADDAGVQLRLQAPDDAPQANRVVADRLRLRQVLVNLLSNGVKYNRPGGHVDVRWSMASDGPLRLVVEDDGLGMTPAQQAHLFEPFNRLGAERSTVEGTGLGLVLCRGLVQLMGGTLAVRSTASRGSCFTLELPQRAPAAGRALPEAGTATAHRTLLYLADDPMHVGLVREILRWRPLHRLLVARNDAQALSLAGEQPPDLLLLDVGADAATGWAQRQGLRAQAPLAALPCIVLAERPLADGEARPEGVAAWLTKPLQVEGFLQQLDAALAPPAAG